VESGLVTLITCTGNRPDAWELCQKFMFRQTIFKQLNVEWLVVDDGDTAVKLQSSVQRLIRGPKTWEEGINTHRLNMDLALATAKGEFIFVVEDDDFYKPNYLEVMLELLQHFEVVGEGNAKYYNVSVPGYKTMHNREHCSLCQTALRASQKDRLYKAVNSGELFFDIVFWRSVIEDEVSSCIFTDKDLCIGMKGLPGRTGIGVGHRKEKKDFYFDPKYKKLVEWLGQDAELYKPFMKERSNARPEIQTKTLRQSNR